MVRIAVRACAALFLTASTLAAEPPRGAMPVGDGDQPRRTVLEYCAVNADRVVVGKVVGIAQPAKIEFAQPYGDGKSAPRWAATCMVEVSETLADRTAASGPASAATRTATIKVLFDRPDPDAPPPTGGSPFYLDPQEGGEYVLLLQKMLQRDEFYLPARTACLQKADPAAVAAVKAALDIDKWPWGETVAGLQLAAVVAPLPYSDAPQGLPDGSQRMMICLAMRNTSTKPIHVFVYALDVTVSGVATNADGQSVKLKDANVRNLQLMRRQATSAATVQPGQVIFFDQFRQTEGTSFSTCLNLQPGKWTFKAQAEFKAPPEVPNAPSEMFWTGKLKSGQMSFFVEKP